MSLEREIVDIEAIILEKFESEPFHNLYFINECKPSTYSFGGTCTDKVLSMYEELRLRDYECYMHVSLVKDRPLHFVVRIVLEDGVYFADVGNGWPTRHLFSADGNTSYSSYGIEFESILREQFLDIYNTRKGIRRLSTSIPLIAQDDAEAQTKIKHRFEMEYPFSDGLRFAQVVEGRFLFLRDLTLSIYSPGNNSPENIKLSPEQVGLMLSTQFQFDLEAYRKALGIEELQLVPPQLINSSHYEDRQ